MLIRTVVLVPTVAFTLAACKPRTAPESAVKAEGEGAPVTEKDRVGELFAHLDVDLAKTLEIYDVAMSGDGSQFQNFALADANTAVALRTMSFRMKLLARETPADKRAPVDAVALELEGLAIILEGNLPGVDDQQVSETLAKAEALLDSKPATDQGQQAQANAQPTETTPAPQAEVNYDVLQCSSVLGGRYMPTVAANGARVGNVGYAQYQNCDLVTRSVRNGLACGLADQDHVSAFRTKGNQQIGPEVGFAQVKNCVNAVVASRGGQICLVDNRPNVNKYAKYRISDGALVDYWFDTLEKCMAGDKSPDPREQCLASCKAKWDRCKDSVERYYKGMEQTSKRLECMLEDLECTKRC